MPKIKKQFDVVIMNPPYQAPKSKKHEGRGKSGSSLWDKFVLLAFDVVKDDGFVCAVHPSGWREPFGLFDNVRDVLRSKQVEYLEVHDRDDGLKTFAAYTSYDWYVAQNCSPERPTIVMEMSGNECSIDISSLPLIPNSGITEVSKLFASNGEETVEVLYSRSDYGTDKPSMQDEKQGKFRYPCVYTVTMNDEINLWWSNTQKNGHFGIPKVIFSNGTSGTVVDKSGEYGLTQFSFAIVDKPQNLAKIQKAITSPEFLKVMAACSLLGKHRYNRKAIACFRADFWKEFV